MAMAARLLRGATKLAKSSVSRQTQAATLATLPSRARSWALKLDPTATTSQRVGFYGLAAAVALTAGVVASDARCDASAPGVKLTDGGGDNKNSSGSGGGGSGGGDSGPPLPLSAARLFLVDSLAEHRQRHAGRLRAPVVRLEVDSSGAAGSPPQHSLTFALPPRSDGLAVVAAFAQALGSNLEIHSASFKGGRSGWALGLLLPLGAGSCLVHGNAPPPHLDAGFMSPATFTLFADGGFTRKQLSAASSAYGAALDGAVAFVGPPRNGDGTGDAQAPGFGRHGFGGFGGDGMPWPRLPGLGGLGGEGSEAAPGPGGQMGQKQPLGKDEALRLLEKLGLEVYEPKDDGPDWDSLAGCEALRAEVEGTLVLALKDGARFDDMARKTRARFESNRPRAVLFEGPPGTGKTLTARVVAKRCGRPLIHVRTEKVVSKWYGESTRNMAQVFDAAEALGAVLFIDEVDALAGSRDTGDMHEATRRVLSVILQRIEGLEGPSEATVVAATNRKQDLDAALLSRFDLTLRFGLPDLEARQAILGRYAKQLGNGDRRTVASRSEGLSGRDLKEVCEHAERRWVAKLIRSEVPAAQDTPPVDEYLACLANRLGAAPGTHQL